MIINNLILWRNKKDISIFQMKKAPYLLLWEAAGSTPAEVGNILLRRLIMKYFLRSFSPFR